MEKFGVGQSIRRIEDQRFLNGTGNYADDAAQEGLLHAAFARSPIAHGTLTSLDIEEAQKVEGVQAIYTGADWHAENLPGLPIRTQLKNVDGSELAIPARYPLIAVDKDKVRHVGDPIAMVVATSKAAAQSAAEQIWGDYEEHGVVAWVEDAKADGAALIHDERPGNVCMDWQSGDAEKTDAGMAKAVHKISVDLVNNRIIPNSMEVRGATAAPFGKAGVSLTGSIQNVFSFHGLLTSTFGLDKDEAHVWADDIGGGFGAKNQWQPEHAMICFAAMKLGKPVRWIAERTEGFLSDIHARAVNSKVELGLDADLKITALRIASEADIGAYCSTNGPLIPTLATGVVMGAGYDVPAAYMRVQGYYTNTPPTDAYRGAGRPEANYLTERVIEVAARQLGVDPVDLRQRNLLKPSQIPYTTVADRNIDSGDFAGLLDKAIAATPGFEKRQSASKKNGKLRGRSVAAYMECTLGVPNEYVKVQLNKDGTAALTVGTQNAGMGHETSFRQLISQQIGVAPEKISYKHADTQAMPQGGGHGGSRSIQIGGGATWIAAGKIQERLKAIASDKLEASVDDIESSDGEFRVVGTDRVMMLEDLLPDMPEDMTETHIYERENHSFPNGVHVCEVEVDPDTGEVVIDRFHVVDDFGTIVNPLLVTGQVQGGVVQGIGQAWLEEVVFDRDTGQLLSGSFMDYCMPRADDVPDVTVEFDESQPSPSNPLGVKGCGEAGAIASTPAFVNAVLDAIKETGVTNIDMPLKPEKIWRTMRDAA